MKISEISKKLNEIKNLKLKKNYNKYNLSQLIQLPILNGVIELKFKNKNFFMLNINNDDGVVIKYLWRDKYEKLSLNLWYMLTRQEGYFADVGAHTGIYSIIGNIGKKENNVISIEPFFMNFTRLVSNLKINNISSNNCFLSALSNVEGVDKMIERCKAYIDAGAEIIFPEALEDEKDFEKVRKELSGYLLANMTEFGKSKLFNYKELENFGYNIVIYPVTSQRLAMKNVEDGLRDIYANGHQNNIIDKMQTRKRLYELVDYEKYNSLDEKIYNFSTEGHE